MSAASRLQSSRRPENHGGWSRRIQFFSIVGRWRLFLIHLSLGERKMLPTKIRFGTSTSMMMMRTAVAFVMAVMLLSIATVCPAIACPLGQVSGTQSRSCCHQPQPQPTSCPRTTIQSCPYLSLEKSTAATTTPDAVSVSLNPVSPELPIVNRLSSFGIEDRLPDSSGLFLRIRVLLI